MTLMAHLARLESAGLIRPAQGIPELEYAFRHALVQEAAYASLVRADRRTLHRVVGEALEAAQAAGDDTLALAAVLGRHFAVAGDDGRAARYFTQAGEGAMRVYGLDEALAHFGSALEAARRMLDQTGQAGGPLPISADVLIRMHNGMGTALELRDRHGEALEVYGRLEVLGGQRGEHAVRVAALLAQAKVYSTGNLRYDPVQARRLLQEALAIIRQGDADTDRAAEARVLWNLMLLNVFGSGGMVEAIAYGEQSIALARQLGLREQHALAAHDLYYAYGATGQPDRAEATLAEARGLWRELGNQVMLADNLSNVSILALNGGRLDEALARAGEALQISRAVDNKWGQATSRFMLGHVYLERGQIGHALELMEEVVALGLQIGHPPALIATRSDLAWAYASLGATGPALELARQAAAWAEGHFPLWRSWAVATAARIHLLRGELAQAREAAAEARRWLARDTLQFMGYFLTPLAEGELALAEGRSPESLAAAEAVIAYNRHFQVCYMVPPALMLRGRALQLQGEISAAQAAFAEALAAAEAIGSLAGQWPALLALSDLAAAAGQEQESNTLRQRAAVMMKTTAEHIPPASLRAAFLGLPEVRRLLGQAPAN
jgi:tetratricopeptide (TPR) repeat protein